MTYSKTMCYGLSCPSYKDFFLPNLANHLSFITKYTLSNQGFWLLLLPVLLYVYHSNTYDTLTHNFLFGILEHSKTITNMPRVTYMCFLCSSVACAVWDYYAGVKIVSWLWITSFHSVWDICRMYDLKGRQKAGAYSNYSTTGTFEVYLAKNSNPVQPECLVRNHLLLTPWKLLLA